MIARVIANLTVIVSLIAAGGFTVGLVSDRFGPAAGMALWALWSGVIAVAYLFVAGWVAEARARKEHPDDL